MAIASRLPERGKFRIPHLRAWRMLVDLRQHELAARSGICRDTIAHVETAPDRQVHGAIVNKLASGLGVPAEALVCYAPRDLIRLVSSGGPADSPDDDGRAA